jgi:cyclohexanone monooxygenase
MRTTPTEATIGSADPGVLDAIIVGAGFAGIYMLYRLRQLGLRALVLEAAPEPGGVWWWNRYPGARCDVESVDYSYSFDADLEQSWCWTELYSTQPEILSYIQHVVDRFDLRRDMRFSTRVVGAELDEVAMRWAVLTHLGEQIVARHLIMATGCLSVTKRPDMPGLDRFEGECYHTGEWPHEPVSFAGKRVGVIGVGSSGTQLIPVAARDAGHLQVFQRTPNFSVPAPNGPMTHEYEREVKSTYPSRRAFTRTTASGLNMDMNRQSALEVTPEEREERFERMWRTAGFGFVLSYSDLLLSRQANQTAVDFIADKIRHTVHNPEVAAALIPTDYPYGAKRPSVDTGYYETYNRNNVELVDIRADPIVEVTASGLTMQSGTHHPLDMLVLATGFDAMTGALARIEIRGRRGLRLVDKWAAGPRTYLGLATSGFPNLFMLAGPGSPSVLTNVMTSIEQHVEWLGELLAYVGREGIVSVEADGAAEDAWVDHVNELAAATLYPQADSWYLGANVPGKPRVFMPYSGGLRAYRRRCAQVAESGYEGFVLVPAAETVTSR